MEVTLNLCRCGLKIFKQICKPSIRCYSEGTVPLNESTLIGRIVLFMNNEYNKSVSTQTDELKIHSRRDLVNIIDKIKLNQSNHISNLKFEQLEELVRNLNSENILSNKRHFQKLMNVIDLECCSRLDYLDSGSVLRILSVFTQSMPNRVTAYKYYTEALQYLMTYIDYLSKEELIQTIFYIALQKKTNDAQTMLKSCLRKFSKEDINALSIEELCIICNSSFKTSTKIMKKEILERVKQALNDKLYILKDEALFITLVKTIRHNKYQDDDLLNTISCTVFFNQTYKYYNFCGLCHILALYADYLYYDENILKLFVNQAISELKQNDATYFNKRTHIREQIRLKDITRFLWALSTLGYKCDNEDIYKDVIVPKIKERLLVGSYNKNIEELVNSILYLWILNYQAEDLIIHTLTEENINLIKDSQSQAPSRLNLLLTCIFFENKKLFRKLKLKAQKNQMLNIQLQLQQRPNLVKVLAALRELEDVPVKKFEITSEIPHLNICGITGYTKNIYKAVYIEVVDNYFGLKNRKSMPNGPMQLKLRILKEKDEALVIVPRDIAEEYSHADLKDYLKTEIELLC